MLIVTRREGETVVFPQLNITVTVTKIWGNKTRIAVDAPEEVDIKRGELLERKRNESDHRLRD